MASTQVEKDDGSEMAKYEETVHASQVSGATAEEEEANMTLGKSIKQYPKIAGYACFVTIAILLWGYDLVVVGTVSSIPAFQ